MIGPGCIIINQVGKNKLTMAKDGCILLKYKQGEDNEYKFNN